MEKYKWQRRTDEWIKANPGKGTMYRLNADGREVVVEKGVVVGILGDDGQVIRKEEVVPVIEVPKRAPSFASKVRDNGGPDAGIYAIICEASKTVYVGQSTSMDTRMRGHKMIITVENSKYSSTDVYQKIKADVAVYGDDCLQYVKFRSMPEATIDELLEAEAQGMIEFLNNGYSLYNASIPKEIMKMMVYCPKEFFEPVNSLVKLLIDRSVNLEDVKALTGSRIEQ